MKKIVPLLVLVCLLIGIAIIDSCKKEDVIPTLTTTTVTNITVNSGTTGGMISKDGGAAVTARGVCWGTTSSPAISGSHTSDDNGAGSFTSNLTGLTPNTLYHVRAYATNKVGTAYGNEVTFTTSPIVIPTVTTTAVSSITLTTAVSGGNITSDGNGAITAGGVCWATTASPTTDNFKTSDATGAGSFTSNLTALLPGTKYYVRAYATNSAGIAYGNELSFTTNTVVGAPTNVVATPGNAQVTVTFLAPLSDGGSAITGYTVTSNPGSFIGTGSASPITVTGLTNGTAYTFTVIATNSNGNSSPSIASNSVIPSTVPGAPIIGTATAGNTQAVVAFTAPVSNGGSSIIAYTVTSIPGGLTGIGSTSPITVTGLTNGTAYTFTVIATNAKGNSPASSASNSVTPSSVPGAPTIGTATKGNAQASVTFTAPASNGGSTITGYTVTSNPGSITGTGSSSPILVTGLTNGTAYTFTVTATNATGTSTPSSASNQVTPSTIPGVPTIGVATAGIAQATVAFTAPVSDGGSAITGYTVTSSPGGITATGTASPLTVTGLTNATAYTFTVFATNANGNSSASSASNTVTPSTVPGAPTIGTATKGNAQASVTFTAPASNGGSVITGYTVTSNPGSFTGTGTSSPITVTGLTNGTVYTFTVIATNAVGNSPASSASNSVTPSTVPGAPTIGAATAGNVQATVAFTAPPNGGSTITGYTVTSSPGSFTATGTGSPLTVTGLTNGIAYTFTVIATNANGNSPASSASNSVTPLTVPGAPTIGTATKGNAQASVTFTAPASNGGSVITGYTVTSNPGTITGTGSTSPIIVTGLTNGTAYTFTVIATNAAGNSPASSASNSVTPSTVPGSPTIGTAIEGDAQASVTFTAPVSNGGSAITGYTVTSIPGSFTGTGTASPITVTGLTNGTAYTFTVIATNANGNSLASSASNSVRPHTPSTIYDVEGNFYNLVSIGTQVWMKENLKTSKYNTGASIPTTTTVDLTGETAPKYQWIYNDDNANLATYGRLYTFYAITDPAGVCPTGMHVPSDAEWITLSNFLINNGFAFTSGGQDIGKSMSSTSGWTTDPTAGNVGNNQATNNTSGFSAVPAGFRKSNTSPVVWNDLGFGVYFRSSTEDTPPGSWYYYLRSNSSLLGRASYASFNGYSVRCVK